LFAPTLRHTVDTMGCGAGRGLVLPKAAKDKDAPFLVEYFAELGKLMEEMDKVDPMKMLFDPEEAKRVQEMQEAHKERLKPWIHMSFDKHDNNKDGSLDRAEAQEFFNLYTRLYFAFHEKYDVMLLKSQMAKGAVFAQGMMADMVDASLQKELEALMKAQEAVAITELQKRLKTKRGNYMANKAALDEEAFKILDTSTDGKVQRQELVEAFMFESERNDEVHLALGLLAADEAQAVANAKKLAGTMQGAGAEGDADCQMQ